jgi:hypothetical protein
VRLGDRLSTLTLTNCDTEGNTPPKLFKPVVLITRPKLRVPTLRPSLAPGCTFPTNGPTSSSHFYETIGLALGAERGYVTHDYRTLCQHEP